MKYLKLYKVILHSLQFFIIHYVSIHRGQNIVRFDFISQVFPRVSVKTRRDSPRRTIRPYHVPQYPNLNATRIETKFTYHRVTFTGKSQCKRRAFGQSKIETVHRVRPGSPVRPLVESKRNKRATRARMQNNTPRRARPVHRAVIPHRANRRIDPLSAHTSPRVRARGIPPRGFGALSCQRGAQSRETREERGERRGEKSAAR